MDSKVTHQGIVIETLPLIYPKIDDVFDNDETIIALDQVTLLAERSFDLVKSSKEDFDKIINDVAKDIEISEDDREKEDLLIKKEILEANYS